MSEPQESALPPIGDSFGDATVRPSAWVNIRDALRGTTGDLTDGSIGRSIVVLAIPMVLEMLMESIFVVVDIFFVARLGAGAVAVVGLTESLMTIVYVIAMGLGIGASAVVARRIGEGDAEGAAHSAAQAILLGVACSIAIGVIGVLLAPQLLRVMGGEPDVVALGTPFTMLMLGSNIVVVVLFLVNAVFRGAGDAAVAMRALWIANIINIILCPCLILGVGPFPELGLFGAALATTIGRGTGALYAFMRLRQRSGHLHVTAAHFRLDPPLMARILNISAAGMFQLFIAMASWIGLVRIVSGFGSDAVAGYTIGIRIIIFALLPSFGMSNAAATLVGQALGAGRPERAEKSVWTAAKWNMAFLGSVGLVFVIIPHALVGIFTDDPRVTPYAVDCLRIVACGFLFYAYEMVITQAFNGAGDTRTPTLINFFALWVFQIPLAYVLSTTMGIGPQGVYIAIAISYASMAVAGTLLFRRGTWKLRKV